VICRYGGEEFALLLPGADLEIAWTKAEVFRTAVEQAGVSSNGRNLGPLTVSIGIATSADFQNPEELTRAADAALYHSKRTGRNAVWVCTPRSVPFPAIDFPPSRPLADSAGTDKRHSLARPSTVRSSADRLFR
jgi:hypothetical protein